MRFIIVSDAVLRVTDPRYTGSDCGACELARTGSRIVPRFSLPAVAPSGRQHDLRHSCASLLLGQGVSPRVVMDALGRSQISLTMNTYAHVLPELRVQGRRPNERADRDNGRGCDTILGDGWLVGRPIL